MSDDSQINGQLVQQKPKKKQQTKKNPFGIVFPSEILFLNISWKIAGNIFY